MIDVNVDQFYKDQYQTFLDTPIQGVIPRTLVDALGTEEAREAFRVGFTAGLKQGIDLSSKEFASLLGVLDELS